jgi:excisionase family DNA binding protein
VYLSNLPDVTTPKELASFLRVSEQTVKRALRSKSLVGFKVGRDWRIEKMQVMEWLNGEHNSEPVEDKSIDDIWNGLTKLL